MAQITSKVAQIITAAAVALGVVSSGFAAPKEKIPGKERAMYANERDIRRGADLEYRAADWRNGAVVYQIIVDRFVPPTDLASKASLYPAPKKLRQWSEKPTKGTFLPEANVWSHEIDFWGGDLRGVQTKIDYLKSIGVNVLYLNPIHQAYTNHKYDSQDYFAVSPEYGTRADVKALAAAAHAAGMKVVLDGVFNHMGRTSPKFKAAESNERSPERQWFLFGPQYKRGFRQWVDVPNLPELNLENPDVRAQLWGNPDSVVQGYLRNEGIDGWRLDVAYDIGFKYLRELTESAHKAKPGSVVIGELWNYPEEWSPSVDGVMNFTGRELILKMVQGQLPAAQMGRLWDQMVADTGLDPMLKAWLVLDNHDVARLPHVVPDAAARRIAQVLQFTLPGSPNVYYGTEAGMSGGDDPENRAPMDWEKSKPGQPEFDFVAGLIAMHNGAPALRYGDFRLVPTERLLAFTRTTSSVKDLRLVVANPSDTTVTELLLPRDSKLMSYAKLTNVAPASPEAVAGGQAQSANQAPKEIRMMAGTITITLPAKSIGVYQPEVIEEPNYTPYKRVQ